VKTRFYTAWVKTGKAQNEQKFSPVAPTADIGERDWHVSVETGLMHRNKRVLFSINSLTVVRRHGELSALTVLRLRTNSSFIACWTGRSEGFAPLGLIVV